MNLALGLVAVFGCAIIGYTIGLWAALHGMQQTLTYYASARSDATDKYPLEALKVLAEMNASAFPPCSDSELESFRRLILKSEYIKDAGRMSGQQLQCSATFSAPNLPDKKYVPSFTEPAGDMLYTDMESLRVGPLTPIVMRLGDSYVALDPNKRDDIPVNIQFSVTMRNTPPGRSNYLGGNPFPGDSDALKINSHGQANGYLYAMKCSDRFSACITAYLSIKEAIRRQRQLLWTWVVGGSLTGACIGLIGILLNKRKRGIEQQLRRAIAHGKLRVVYQPLVNLNSREVVGGEALVRWTDEDRLAISPDVFIRIAEERGFVGQITKLVVHRTLADFKDHMEDNPHFRINVNISSYDLADPTFLPMLEDALRDAGVRAPSLGIELTETATAKREMAIDVIAQLRLRGHAVYIDDFGTGYSSLAYLRDLSVNGIKIDRSFTQTVGTESVTEGILPQILAMAQALRLGVVAEGVETEAHYAYYRETDLSLTAQGWFFGQAVPPEEFHQRWLKREKPSSIGAEQA